MLECIDRTSGRATDKLYTLLEINSIGEVRDWQAAFNADNAAFVDKIPDEALLTVVVYIILMYYHKGSKVSSMYGAYMTIA